MEAIDYTLKRISHLDRYIKKYVFDGGNSEEEEEMIAEHKELIEKYPDWREMRICRHLERMKPNRDYKVKRISSIQKVKISIGMPDGIVRYLNQKKPV